MAYFGIIATLIAFVPPGFFFYFTMAKYDGFFDDRKVSLTFMIGIFHGLFVGIFWGIVGFPSLGQLDLALLSFGLGLPAVSELGKLILLNRKRYQLKFDTTFYGISLSTGSAVMLLVYIGYRTLALDHSMAEDPVFIAGLVAFAIGMGAVSISSGALIGFGVSKGLVWGYLLTAILINGFYNTLLLPYLWNLDGYPVFLFVTLLFAFYAWSYVVMKVLPRTLPEEIQKKLRRERRKQFRQSDEEEYEKYDEYEEEEGQNEETATQED